MYTGTYALEVASTRLIPHARTDIEVVNFIPVWDASSGRGGIGESAVNGGGIELFKG
jgi:hypothetical protein